MRSLKHTAAGKACIIKSTEKRACGGSRHRSPTGSLAAWSRALCESLESRRLLSNSVTLSTDFIGRVAPPPSNMHTPGAPLDTAPYSPAQIRSAYGVDKLSFNAGPGNGAGQTIAIVDAYNDPNIIADTNYFSSFYGLQQFNVAGGPTLTVLGPDGSTTLPSNDPPDPTALGNDVEESVDVQWAHSIAPQANIVVYEASSSTVYFDPNSQSGLNQAIKSARANPAVSVVSISYGLGEFSAEAGLDAGLFTTPAGHQGITFLSSTGDGGAPGGYFAFSPDVIAVGGTSISINASDNSYNSEVGWSGSGGGISQYEAIPSYQASLGGVNGASTTKRNIPDVSMEADNSNGILAYDSLIGGANWWEGGGTSLAAPMWGGLIALADQARTLAGVGTLDGLSQTLPRLYQLRSADFHDITSGNNGDAAGPGYDLVTGLGSPIANLLVPDLAFQPSDFVVTNTNDSGSGSLRQAMLNANAYGRPETISFKIPSGSLSNGAFTISPATQLPTITDPQLVIDGNTQETYTGATNSTRPVIYLDGGGRSINGLVMTGFNDGILNLGINDFKLNSTLDETGGVVLAGSTAQSDVVQGCWIGIAPNGTSAAGNNVGINFFDATNDFLNDGGTGNINVVGFNNLGVAMFGSTGSEVYNADIGVTPAGAAVPNGAGVSIASSTGTNGLFGAATGNFIEVSDIGDNNGDGVLISGNGSTGNILASDLIGVTYSTVGGLGGYYAAPNEGDGVLIYNGAANNIIGVYGGSPVNTTSIIAGNDGNGVEIEDSSGTQILGTTVGEAVHLVRSGQIFLTVNSPNLGAGVYIHDGAANNQIGSTTTNNVISGNDAQGILFDSDAGAGNSVIDNYIGTSSAGASIGNSNEGMLISSNGETITGNVISGNAYSGMSIVGNSNSVTGNYIGINPAGIAALPNQHEGIYLSGSSNTISGNVISGNGISGNGYTGISPVGNNNTIANNYIGLNAAGNAAIPNQGDGIGDTGTSNTFSNDVVSGNAASGIDLQGGGNTVSGCYVGTNAAGNAAIPNQTNGVLVGGASNIISGDVLSGNAQSGIALDAGNNTVSGCKIGTDSAGSVAITNEIGVYISGSGNVIGGTFASTRNVISGNTAGSYGDGVFFDTSSASSNTVEGNYIGLNAAGTAALPNVNGVYLRQGAANNTIGSLAAGGGNVISGNSNYGVDILTNATGTRVVGNYIGTNAAGTAAMGNSEGVVVTSANNTIGGLATAARNVISGNASYGVAFQGTSALGEVVEGNYIGTNAACTAAVANYIGVEVDTGSTADIISNNVIAGHGLSEVALYGNASTGSLVVGNFIGTDYTGTLQMGSSAWGIYVYGDHSQIGEVVGGQAEGNTIDYNPDGNVCIANSSGAYLVASTMYGGTETGILNYGTLTVYNCTVAGNTGMNDAGIINTGTLVIDDSTITMNAPTGIDSEGGTVTLQNDIVANNGGEDIVGSVSASSTYNLIGNGTGLTGISNGTGHNQIGTAASPIDPQLNVLANNGGPTQTIAPKSTSPAINAGIANSLNTDQRGDPRPTSGAVDIGAVQHQGNAVSITANFAYLRLDSTGQTLDVYLNNTGTGSPSQTYPVSSISSLSVTGTSGADELTVDYSNGNLTPAGVAISYDGLNPFNSLQVVGTAGNDTIVWNPSSVTIGSSTINYTNVQTGVVNPLGGSDSLTLASDVTLYFPVAPTGGGILTRTLSSLTLGGGAVLYVPTSATRATDRTLLVVQSASIASTARIDLGGNDADFTNLPLATVTSLLKTAFNGGTWNGFGIDSSFAASNTAHLTALGVVQNNQGGSPLFTSSTPFDGTIPGAGDVLIKYTYYGDANLDGKVNGSDYSRIDNGVLNHLTGWFNGDFNYDGILDGSDYTFIDNAFNTQGASLTATISNLAAATTEIATPVTAKYGSSVIIGAVRIQTGGRMIAHSLTPSTPSAVFQLQMPITFSGLPAEGFAVLMQKKDVLDFRVGSADRTFNLLN